MPYRIPRPCRCSRCPGLTSDASGYCPKHRHLQSKHRSSGWQQWQQQRGSVTERGYGGRWQRLRLKVLKRDDYLCQQCQALGLLTRASHVDHIVPKSQGGDDALANLQSLCPACHHAKTGGEHRRRP